MGREGDRCPTLLGGRYATIREALKIIGLQPVMEGRAQLSQIVESLEIVNF